MDPNDPQFWQNSSFMGFNSYDQSTPVDYQQQSSAQLPYTHPDWPERPSQVDQRIADSTFNPTLQPSQQYLSQPNPYDPSPGNLISVQRQPLSNPFSHPNSANVNTDLPVLPGDQFLLSNDEYRRKGNFSPQRTTFSNQALTQIPAPPALYHPGGQPYRHQALSLSDVSSESSALSLFGGGSMQSRVPSQDGCACRFLVAADE